MTQHFDTRQVRRAFSRAAQSYDANAALQHVVEERLLERLEYAPADPQRVLDLGCGPGRASGAMRKRFRKARIVALDIAQPMLQLVELGWLHPVMRVAGDARELPFADASMDIIFSSLCVQWVSDLPRLFAECRRVLKVGGYFAFSTFGPDTLHELRAAWSQADALPHVSNFADMPHVGAALVQAGFRDPVLDSEFFTLTYSDARAAMLELKTIGATNADLQRSRGLTGRTRYTAALAAYEAQRIDGTLPATYEVIYGHAFAPGEGQPRRGEGSDVATFSVDNLRGSRRSR